MKCGWYQKLCLLCKIVEQAKQTGQSDFNIVYRDPLMVIADSPGNEKSKDGFVCKIVVFHEHAFDPLPPIKDKVVETARVMYRKRVFWFPQTTDNKNYTVQSKNKKDLDEWPSHWHIYIE